MTSPAQRAAQNKALVRRFFEAVDAGDAAAMDELVREDYLDRQPPPFPGLPPGRAGLKKAIEMFRRSTPGRHEVLDQIASGDLVITRICVGGRPGIPDSGVTAMAVHRVRDGLLVEHLGELEAPGVIEQSQARSAVS